MKIYSQFNSGVVEEKPVVKQEKAKVPPKALKSLVNRSKQVPTKTETQPIKTETQKTEAVEQSSSKTLSDLEALEKLAKLRDLGILTEEEFVQKKMQLLGL